MTCPGPTAHDFTQPDICIGRMYAHYLLTGKHPGPPGSGHSAAVKEQLVQIAAGALTLKPGHSGRLKLRPNKDG